jgi:hypothetical protein
MRRSFARTIVASVLAAHAVTLHDPRIDEASGIAQGIGSPGVYYVQNDSGDSARFFAVDVKTGRTRAVFTVPGAVNHDWEDLAVAPDDRGTPSVWLADIGDNDASRSEVDVYRVDEPRVDMSHYGRTETTARPDMWRLRYPSGPVDAESLAVTPSGRAFVITKAATGRSTVYELPARPDPNRVQTMRRIAAIRLPAHGGLVPATLQRLATGAAINADGSLLVVRTYTDAYLWRIHRDDVAAALRHRPRRVALPLQQQGEGVCFAGQSLALDSEGRGTAIVRVPLPGPAPSPSTSSASSAPNPPPSASPSPPAAPQTSNATSSHTALYLLGGVVAVAVVAIAWIGVRRRRE